MGISITYTVFDEQMADQKWAEFLDGDIQLNLQQKKETYTNLRETCRDLSNKIKSYPQVEILAEKHACFATRYLAKKTKGEFSEMLNNDNDLNLLWGEFEEADSKLIKVREEIRVLLNLEYDYDNRFDVTDLMLYHENLDRLSSEVENIDKVFSGKIDEEYKNELISELDLAFGHIDSVYLETSNFEEVVWVILFTLFHPEGAKGYHPEIGIPAWEDIRAIFETISLEKLEKKIFDENNWEKLSKSTFTPISDQESAQEIFEIVLDFIREVHPLLKLMKTHPDYRLVYQSDYSILAEEEYWKGRWQDISQRLSKKSS